MPLIMKSILELLQRLLLYKTLANTSSLRTTFNEIGLCQGENYASLFIVCCVPDVTVAELDNDVALKQHILTVVVGGYYVPATT